MEDDPTKEDNPSETERLNRTLERFEDNFRTSLGKLNDEVDRVALTCAKLEALHATVEVRLSSYSTRIRDVEISNARIQERQEQRAKERLIDYAANSAMNVLTGFAVWLGLKS